jgi:predicted MFS family arabinose efflux permease
VRFVFANPFLRTVLVIAAPLNFAFNGIMFAVIANLQRHGTPPAIIGTAETIFGVGGLIGAFAAPALQRWLRLPVLVVAICWASAALMAISSLLTTSVAVAIPMAGAVFLGPAANAALFGYQAAITPDRLQGRVVSVILFVAMSVATVAPVVAGALITTWGGPAAMLTFALVVAGSAIAATVSKGIRTAGPIAELAAQA